VYWIPLFEILEQRGFEVLLVNARNVHNVRGRKSDVSDCEWLRELHSVGLLRASFRPAAAIVPLRSYLRPREILVEEAATRIQRMQKALSEMNLKLHTVLTDITGQTGLTIVRDILKGERDPERLATHRDPRCHASHAEIVAALTGNYRTEHLFALKQTSRPMSFCSNRSVNAMRRSKPCTRRWPPSNRRLLRHCLLPFERGFPSIRPALTFAAHCIA